MNAFESPSHFFAELNHRFQELGHNSENAGYLHLIISDIGKGFTSEDQLKALVIKGVVRQNAEATFLKEYLNYRPQLRQAFEKDSDVRFAFMAHFADLLAASYEH